MSRDHRRLRVFQEADALVPLVYQATQTMPAPERFGLQMQLRRAAVSVPTNLVEGSARSTTKEYCRFVEVALGSSREVEYLLTLSAHLNYVTLETAQLLAVRYDRLSAGLAAAIRSLQRLDASRPHARRNEDPSP